MDDLLIWNVDAKDEHLILELLPVVTQRTLEEMYARVNSLPLKSIRTLIKGSLRSRLIFFIVCLVHTTFNIQSSL